MTSGASVIIPSFKRITQTCRTIDLILASNGLSDDFVLEVIVVDSSPDDALKKSLLKRFGDRIIYTRPQKPGIATNKNHGARIASHPIIIFCDSDIEIAGDTIKKTLACLGKHKTAAAIGGTVRWHGGGHRHDTRDRPRPEDRRVVKNGTTYIETVYSRYIATYKDIFWHVGGYDEDVFNMRGEGSDLSIRYWRAGYPLVYDEEIVVKHIHNVPDSIALRVSHPEWGIAKDMLLLAYKYDMLEGNYPNFLATAEANFKSLKSAAYFEIIRGIGNYLPFIAEKKSVIDEQKKNMKPVFPFKFLEIFSDKKLLAACLCEAEKRMEPILEKGLY